MLEIARVLEAHARVHCQCAMNPSACQWYLDPASPAPARSQVPDIVLFSESIFLESPRAGDGAGGRGSLEIEYVGWRYC